MELKKPLDFQSQVERLKFHNMIINDTDKAKKILSEINYYRFTGYALQFREKENNENYLNGTIFENIYKIYEFDSRVRNFLRKYIEIVEVYYKTQISYWFSMIKCKESPHMQHYDEKNFYNKAGYNKVIDNFKKEENYYKDSLIVKHHKFNYNNKMPLWVMVELMSFSNASKLYSAMYLSDKEKIAKKLGIGYLTLENNLHCLSVFRNKCAHAARLYNTEFNPPARFTKQFLSKYPDFKNNSLFAYILTLLKRLPNKALKIEMKDELEKILIDYKDYIDMQLIGFTKNYKVILNNNIH